MLKQEQTLTWQLAEPELILLKKKKAKFRSLESVTMTMTVRGKLMT